MCIGIPGTLRLVSVYHECTVEGKTEKPCRTRFSLGYSGEDLNGGKFQCTQRFINTKYSCRNSKENLLTVTSVINIQYYLEIISRFGDAISRLSLDFLETFSRLSRDISRLSRDFLETFSRKFRESLEKVSRKSRDDISRRYPETISRDDLEIFFSSKLILVVILPPALY
jgi:hypothetical protein